MKKMSYAEAIREGMSIRMREDPNVLLFGEDVGRFWRLFRCYCRYVRRIR